MNSRSPDNSLQNKDFSADTNEPSGLFCGLGLREDRLNRLELGQVREVMSGLPGAAFRHADTRRVCGGWRGENAATRLVYLGSAVECSLPTYVRLPVSSGQDSSGSLRYRLLRSEQI